MSVKFFILSGQNKRPCEATDSHKAAQILRFMFHNSKGYVVENNKIAFAQNMTIEEAAIEHGLKVAVPVQSMEVLPVAPAAKPKKTPAKAKKTTMKSKVVVKAKKKAPAKKAAVKVKAKPKTKAKKPVKAKKPAPKGKAKKR